MTNGPPRIPFGYMEDGEIFDLVVESRKRQPIEDVEILPLVDPNQTTMKIRGGIAVVGVMEETPEVAEVARIQCGKCQQKFDGVSKAEVRRKLTRHQRYPCHPRN